MPQRCWLRLWDWKLWMETAVRECHSKTYFCKSLLQSFSQISLGKRARRRRGQKSEMWRGKRGEEWERGQMRLELFPFLPIWYECAWSVSAQHATTSNDTHCTWLRGRERQRDKDTERDTWTHRHTHTDRHTERWVVNVVTGPAHSPDRGIATPCWRRHWGDISTAIERRESSNLENQSTPNCDELISFSPSTEVATVIVSYLILLIFSR